MSLPKKPIRVLVVEDNEHLLDILLHDLKKSGYETRSVSDGYQAGFQVREFRLVLFALLVAVEDFGDWRVAPIDDANIAFDTRGSTQAEISVSTVFSKP